MPSLALDQRASGLLLHPTSLPGRYGSGDLGPEARRFASQLARAGQRWWLMLPVGPVGYGNSPYSALSAFAGNPLLIDLEQLAKDGWLPRWALSAPPAFPEDRVEYARVAAFRHRCLREAFDKFRRLPRTAPARREADAFADAQRAWLADFSLYAAIKSAQQLAPWVAWPPVLRDRQPAALREASATLATEVAFHSFEQWQFDRQWTLLREHCQSLGVGLIGDIPIFVAHDSADVWAHRELFRLNARGDPTAVAGVPPDYFSRTGQLWGNPLYRWEQHRRSGYAWWTSRLRRTLELFDAARIDHFIGFHRSWQVPAGATTAEKGHWSPGPGAEIFKHLRARLGRLPLIAEDLGVVTPEVKALRDAFDLPGIRILQFAFGNDPCATDFLPHNYPRRCVVFTGTHDNDTTVGWFNDRGGSHGTRSTRQAERERRAARLYLGDGESEINWAMVRLASESVAGLSIFPVQDVLGLGSEARMNRPGTAVGNWEWRLPRSALTGAVLNRLATITRTYGRWPPP